MPSKLYLRENVHVFVLISLAIQFATCVIPEDFNAEQRQCANEVLEVFDVELRGEDCLKSAIRDLTINSEKFFIRVIKSKTFVKKEYAFKYYEHLRDEIISNNVRLPENYCTDKENDAVLTGIRCSVSDCIEILREIFPSVSRNQPMTIQQIVHQVYNNECDSIDPYRKSHPQLFVINLYFSNVVVNYVKHVSESVDIKTVPSILEDKAFAKELTKNPQLKWDFWSPLVYCRYMYKNPSASPSSSRR